MSSNTASYRSALLVITQRIGDVLLATPIIASLKHTWPGIAIDVLVLAGTEGVLEGNPHIRQVIPIRRKDSLRNGLSLLRHIWRRYDLALSPIPGDRPALLACAAGRQRMAPVLSNNLTAYLKQGLLTRSVPYNERETHTVRMALQVAELCGARPVAEVQVCWSAAQDAAVRRLIEGGLGARPFAVVHPSPRYRYKMWQTKGWRDLSHWLLAQGLQVVVTGGGEASERALFQEIFPSPPVGVHDRIGAHSLGEIAALLARATLYVGPDTVTTHMAAGLGIPTVALYGPSDPVKWGPWPKGHDGSRNPYTRFGTQHVGNVVLIQGAGDCVPCFLEGCDRHNDSDSRCLQTLPVTQVREAIGVLLSGKIGSTNAAGGV